MYLPTARCSHRSVLSRMGGTVQTAMARPTLPQASAKSQRGRGATAGACLADRVAFWLIVSAGHDAAVAGGERPDPSHRSASSGASPHAAVGAANGRHQGVSEAYELPSSAQGLCVYAE